MKTTTVQQVHVSKRLTLWAMMVAGILFIPLVARFPWTTGDYIFAGVVLFGAATIYELGAKNMSMQFRILLGVGVLTAVLLIWAWAVA